MLELERLDELYNCMHVGFLLFQDGKMAVIFFLFFCSQTKPMETKWSNVPAVTPMNATVCIVFSSILMDKLGYLISAPGVYTTMCEM